MQYIRTPAFCVTVALTTTFIYQLRSYRATQEPPTHDTTEPTPINKNKPTIMSASERTPLINASTRSQVANAVPSKEQRIKVAEVAGALQAGKLPCVKSGSS